MVEPSNAPGASVTNPMTPEDIRFEYEKFTEIIFERLEKVLEKRPQNPVRKFVSK